MKHSNQARELLLTDSGIELADVFVGPDGSILTGSARVAQEMMDRAATTALQQDHCGQAGGHGAEDRRSWTTRIAEMQAELAAEADELGVTIAQQERPRLTC